MWNLFKDFAEGRARAVRNNYHAGGGFLCLLGHFSMLLWLQIGIVTRHGEAILILHSKQILEF
jgi:hypothetical protein